MTDKLEVHYANGKYFVRLNGRDVTSAFRSISTEMVEEDVPVVRMELAVDAIEVSSLGSPNNDYVCHLSSDVIDVLKGLGWTPPAVPADTFSVPRPPYDPEDFPDLKTKAQDVFGGFAAALYGRPKRANVLDGLFDRARSREPLCTCSAPRNRLNVAAFHHPTCDMYELDNQSPDATD